MDFAKAYRQGNEQRIKKLIHRAQKGEKLGIAFIGGSITQGCLSSAPETCYAYRVYEYWKNSYPNSEFSYINAGIGGTTSHFGCGRVAEDVLSHKPDFVLVEFAVNDECTEFYKETFEGLIRRIFYDESEPAVLILYNVFYQNGCTAERVHSQVARYYNIPAVSLHTLLYSDILSGEIKMEELTLDGLHPNDKGHGILADLIVSAIEKMKNLVTVDIDIEDLNTNSGDKTMEKLPPLTCNKYENATRYQSRNYEAVSTGFEAMKEIQNGVADCFKYGWRSTDKEASITFEVDGSEIAIQYRRYHDGSAPVARVLMDGNDTGIVLDGNFDEDWGDKLEITPVMVHGNSGRHTVTVQISEDKDTAHPFELISVIWA